ncbi:hypothetical protein HDE_01648 [Halotydeus destructor]|nr:hypothetical protein HDE_01648 [Halotydeus destructor]
MLFDTVTHVSYLLPQNITIPKLVFCEPIKFHLLRMPVNSQNIGQYTPSAILRASDNSTHMIDSVITDIEDVVKFYNRSKDPCHEMPFEIERFTKHGDVCITLRFKPASEIRQPTDTHIPLYRHMYTTKLNTILSPVVAEDGNRTKVRWLYFAHAPEKKCYGNYDPYITRFTQQPHDIYLGLTFSYMKVKLMGWPYKSKCIDYKVKRNLESQAHCYEECYKAAALAKTGYLPSTLLGEESDTVILAKPNCNETICFKDIRFRCGEECQYPDCLSEKFVIEQLWEEASPSNDSTRRRTEIALHPPQRPMTSVKEEPKVSTIDFISFLLGAFGFWFAFSPLVYLTTSEKAGRVIGHCLAYWGKFGGKRTQLPIDIQDGDYVARV